MLDDLSSKEKQIEEAFSSGKISLLGMKLF